VSKSRSFRRWPWVLALVIAAAGLAVVLGRGHDEAAQATAPAESQGNAQPVQGNPGEGPSAREVRKRLANPAVPQFAVGAQATPAEADSQLKVIHGGRLADGMERQPAQETIGHLSNENAQAAEQMKKPE
jgi:hypothetical protein